MCEIGSGFGGLARYIARHNNMRCVGLENMPFCALVSHLGDMFCGRGRCRTVWCDAFEYLDNPENTFDVAVAFLGPDLTVRAARYSQNFPVMISLDFALPGVQAAHVIDVPGGGWVKYKGKKYPHKLFVYEFRDIV